MSSISAFARLFTDVNRRPTIRFVRPSPRVTALPVAYSFTTPVASDASRRISSAIMFAVSPPTFRNCFRNRGFRKAQAPSPIVPRVTAVAKRCRIEKEGKVTSDDSPEASFLQIPQESFLPLLPIFLTSLPTVPMYSYMGTVGQIVIHFLSHPIHR